MIVSDAHIGHGPREPAEQFHRFLQVVPDLCDHLVINGDLFEFWFEYRSVIPRGAYRTLEALSAVRRAGVRITVIGGNHDRWGGPFWREELGADFHPHAAEIDLVGFRALLRHGDGLTESQWTSRVLQAVVGHSMTARLFRWIHPDVGMGLVNRMSPHLAGKARDTASVDRAAQRQREHAEALLTARQDLDLVVLGHTHRSQLVEVAPERWFLNPGGWVDGQRYARVTEDGPKLERFHSSEWRLPVDSQSSPDIPAR
ncbi:MAG: UDP-2,3-diacylglucosamine diphosphatase [Gemmatimonadota bacterium]